MTKKLEDSSVLQEGIRVTVTSSKYELQIGDERNIFGSVSFAFLNLSHDAINLFPST